MTTFTVATNEYRGGGGERTEYHPCVAWDRLAEICGQFLEIWQSPTDCTCGVVVTIAGYRKHLGHNHCNVGGCAEKAVAIRSFSR